MDSLTLGKATYAGMTIFIAVAAGGRPGGIANGASHRAGDEETYSKYTGGIRVNKHPSRRQHKQNK